MAGVLFVWGIHAECSSKFYLPLFTQSCIIDLEHEGFSSGCLSASPSSFKGTKEQFLP